MLDLYLFFFKIQFKTLVKAFAFAILASFFLSFISINFAVLSISITGFLVSIGWTRTMMAGVFNSSWISTLPISRKQIVSMHILLLFSGMSILGVGGSLQFMSILLALSLARTSGRSLSSASPGESSAAEPSSVTFSFPEFENMFGHDMVLYSTLLIALGAMFVLLMTSYPAEKFTPGKTPPLSGNPWWHPNLNIRYSSWLGLLGPPAAILILAPFGKTPSVAYLNFFIALLWLTYNMGVFAAVNAKVPQKGWRHWLIVLTLFQVAVGIMGVGTSLMVSYFNT